MKHLFGLIFLLSGTAAFGQTADSAAKLLSIKEYVIPQDATDAGIDGQLGVIVWVKKDGIVDRAEVVSGPLWPCGSSPKSEIQKVRDGIHDTVMAAKFSPAVKNGKPQSDELLLTVLIGKALEDRKRRNQLGDNGNTPSEPRLISGGVINGRALSLPKPEYPAAAEASRASGAVQIQVLIDEKGDVILAGATGGPPVLQDAARNAACKSKFSTTLLKGYPVKVSGIITYNFTH